MIDQLRANDFEIKQILPDMLLVLLQHQSEKEGPTIGYLAEYDALPGLGHACGHNNSALKQSIINHIGGKVVVLGCPAEEGGENGSAKASYVKAGVIDDIDIALMIHPEMKHIQR